MSRIKLLHLTSSLKIGGAETMLYNLISTLSADQFEQAVIYFNEGPFVKKIKSLDIRTYHVKGLFFKYDPIFFIRLFWLIKKLQPDCLHTLLWMANFTGRIIARLLQIRCISVFHNNVNQDGFIRSFVDYCTIAYSNQMITVSQEVKQSLLNRHTWMSAKEINVISNGVDAKEIQAKVHQEAVTRKSLGISVGIFIFGSVGRFEPVKNYSLLITAFAKSKLLNAHLILVGIGSEEQKLRILVNKLGITSLVTFIIGEPASRYYSLFDCFVMTSSQEGISMALLEAMSCELPCIVTNRSKKHSVVEESKTGLIVEAENEKLLIAGLTKIQKNPSLCKRLGANARAHVVKHFDNNVMVEQYKKLFRINR